MNRLPAAGLIGLLALVLCATPVLAQDFVVNPFGQATYTPVVTYGSVIRTPRRMAAYAPVISPAPAVMTYVAPRVRTYRPVVRYPATIHYPAPVVTYRPAVVRYRVPVTTYRPVISPVVPALVPSGTLLVRPKVYVYGQPIRNALRAMSP